MVSARSLSVLFMPKYLAKYVHVVHLDQMVTGKEEFFMFNKFIVGRYEPLNLPIREVSREAHTCVVGICANYH